MIITLTPKQRKAVDQLLAERRLEAVPIDRPKAAAFLQNAREAVEDLANLTRPQTRYTLAYDAAHDVGEALLAACGYRTKSGAGQHDALGAFLRAVLDSPPGDEAARRFDRLRRARNRARYAAVPIGEAEAHQAVQTAHALIEAATARGAG
ncbi:HEPN domain-containing protein [Tessaracoccus oleiagri]|uniref:HEPN domain-containing protein n=1 Tax=Tessaracoccus oleiagri TaxID=686624 RepID=A0A1G9H6D7_9ACTN|nr:HEPN domain-containing protein [Tessaracoccus oleiagri]SDL07963.1 HEPN domain-containing protein [Tessaracoccus oleiagri]